MAIVYLSGDTQPLFAPIASSQIVSVGDAVGLVSNTLVRAQDFTWQSAVATPTAPTAANAAVAIGSLLTAALTGVKISYQFPWGEGTTSTAATATPTAGAAILVSGASLVPPSPALYTNIYVETSAGSGTYKLWGSTVGPSVLVTSYGAGQVPYAANPGAVAVLSGALQCTQYQFAAVSTGFVTQAKLATGFFGTAQTAPYGNSLPVARVCTAGTWAGDLSSATTVQAGQYLALAQDVGNNLLSQTLTVVPNRLLSIGQATQSGTNLTRVQFSQVDILVAGA